ncbi:MAG: carboxypeptidase regulatory-like domain-containing protein [Actinomycetota bacterium]|nr:carboxypeptidase regulatory-like domain-containing protein [Actinomycetota bacterium]
MIGVPGGVVEALCSLKRRLVLAGLTAVLLITSVMALEAPPAGAFGSSEPPPLPSVSAGGYMTCAVQADGTAACWGENGVPSNDVANVSPGGQATPPAGVRFLEVNAGYATACGITTDQTVVCWGNDRFGKVSQVPPGTYTHVVPGLNYVCALRTDGTIACWGGDDPAAPGADPEQRVVRDVPSGQFTQLTVGIRHACALSSDGTVTCWGHNAYGQTDVPEGTYTHVNAGNFTTCAIRTDGTAVCWGRNQGGQLTVPEGTFTQLSVGFAHVCGLRPDGTITCWGRNSEGQATPPAGTFTHVSAGTFHSCAMPTSGPPAVCWGNNQGGRVQPSMSDAAAPSGTVGDPYQFQLTMVTHVAPDPTFSVVAGSLPPGVTLSPDGLLSGTPTTAGTYEVTVAATNGLSPPTAWWGPRARFPAPRRSDLGRHRHPGLHHRDPTGARGHRGPGDAHRHRCAGRRATVVVTAADGSEVGRATTDSSGRYRIERLADGQYTVTVEAPHFRPQAATATVERGEITSVDFVLKPGGGPPPGRRGPPADRPGPPWRP